LALKHDIEYLTSGEKFNEDYEAVKNADYSLQGYAMKLGLMSRMFIDSITHVIPFIGNFHLNNDTSIPILDLREAKKLAKPMLAKWGVETNW